VHHLEHDVTTEQRSRRAIHRRESAYAYTFSEEKAADRTSGQIYFFHRARTVAPDGVVDSVVTMLGCAAICCMFRF
jgi:hypothetical protein